MTDTTVTSNLTGFARYLVTNQGLNERDVNAAVLAAANNNTSLILQLCQTLPNRADELARAVSQFFGLPLVELDEIDQQKIPQQYLNMQAVREDLALPLFIEDGVLHIAVADPTLPSLNDISFATGERTTFLIANNTKLEKLIEKFSDKQLDFALGDIHDSELEQLDTIGNTSKGDEIKSDDAPVVRYINKVLTDAINQGASDIHFEPFEHFYRIRFRLDGILEKAAEPPIKLAQYLTARLKVMANLDISEKRLPQDGRFKLQFSKYRAIDFRVNTCPTLYGEKIVLRILESSTELLNLDTLGFSQPQKNTVLEKIKQSQGMILVTGPTGSGKTISLYTFLSLLNQPEKNISSVEDPVEIQLPGINQVQINTKTGLNFASSLRAFLRQDPDIIMVGEIRDLETAEISVKASQTGHLVLSTLHTNSAAETLVRLANMGIPAYNIASSISLIIAQRLVRCLCEHCKKPLNLPDDVLLSQGFLEDELNDLTLFGPGECEHCNHGYRGRIGIYEVLPISEAMTALILNSGNALEIAKLARQEGHPDLLRSGLDKVKAGITSLDEINRTAR